jgi:hypothetical protein
MHVLTTPAKNGQHCEEANWSRPATRPKPMRVSEWAISNAGNENQRLVGLSGRLELGIRARGDHL